MAFLNKEETERYAREHGLDLTGKSWQEKQAIINRHMKESGETFEPEHVRSEREEIARLKAELEEAKRNRPVPQVPVIFDRGRNAPAPTIEDYENVTLIASPEQRPTPFQRNKWYEVVGTQKDTREVSFDVGGKSPFGDDESGTRNATYVVHDTGRPVEAESTMPKYSTLLTYRPTRDLCAVAEYNGHRGYLWTHHRLPNVRAMLDQMGVYEEFKGEWQKAPGRIFYLAGLLCCDIGFTESMFERIQRELRRRQKAEDAGL